MHDFAFSLNPHYRYEEGRYGDVAVRVLYQPRDTVTWGRGVAVERTETALGWLDSLFGPFPWPQLTNVHRIEGGGTEYPMMVMDGSASLGLILHEVGHNYTMGILANNEWREGWLDEGFTSFQSAWYFETHGGAPAYPGLERNILAFDLDGWSEPVSMRSEHFTDFLTYNVMIYSKAQLLYEQLRYVVGDEVMRRILRTYYARWRLKHVNEDAFRSVAEEVSGRDLKWLFGQWLHGTPLIDYRLKRVHRSRLADGSWHTAVTIQRLGDGWMPVEVGEADGARVFARATGEPREETLEFVTPERPGRIMLDPRSRTHDWNMLNNGGRRWEVRLDHPLRDDSRRDAYVARLLPVLWYNDFGGTTLALKTRGDYLGRFQRTTGFLTVPLRAQARERFPRWLGFYHRVSDPVTE
ncbi:MAG: M1 family aminopeptidase, partial [Gemmatimonadales bacterium]